MKSISAITRTEAGLLRLAPNLRRRMDMSRCLLMRRCGSGLIFAAMNENAMPQAQLGTCYVNGMALPKTWRVDCCN